MYSASSFCPVSSTRCADLVPSLSSAAEDFLRGGAWCLEAMAAAAAVSAPFCGEGKWVLIGAKCCSFKDSLLLPNLEKSCHLCKPAPN